MYKPGDTLLNKYRIDALAGQGAFAQVYRATHLSLNAPRALKVLRRDAPGIGSTEYADYRARFQLEARLGAALDHPHVIRVYDFEQEGEALILVMEYAAGGSLAERIAAARAAGGFIPIDEAVRIAREAAAGLAALHALDVVHRDVKPSNLLFDERGRVKVSDLGLAQIPHGPSQRSLGGSLALPHPGTPAYMSPEQQFTTAYLPPASDVYSLGVVLFELLTGRAYKNLKPGTRLRKLRNDAPEWLDALLARMLAQEPDGRPWDGSEAAEALDEGQRIAAEKRMAAEAERARQAEAERQRKEREAEAARQAAEERQRQAREAEVARQAEAAAQRRGSASAPAPQREAEVSPRSPTAAVGAGSPRPSSVPATWQRIGIELIKIPAGEFLYGDNKHKITLPEYWIAKTPVTNAQYKAFVDSTGYRVPDHWLSGQIPQGKDNYPIVGVNWNDACEFCRWIGLDLPSEQEWEKAARGTRGREFPWGEWQEGRCNSSEANMGDTSPVNRFPNGATPYGPLDMAGNIWEWCEDWYDLSHSKRALRGGSWLCDRHDVRSTARDGRVPDEKSNDVGFRCARSRHRW